MKKAIKKNSKKGFTLVELVIVIAILAILAAIAIPVVNSIVNTASRNTALSNADTIELAIKECQADIAARNGEIYPEAADARRSTILVANVASTMAIEDAFEPIRYNGVEYEPVWDTINDKCVFLQDSTHIEIETGAVYSTPVIDCVPLAQQIAGVTRISNAAIVVL